MENIYDPIAAALGPWTMDLSQGAVLLRIALSMSLSAIVGCERSSKRHAAGLRTFVLVSLSSTVAMLLDLYLAAAHGGRYFLLSVVAVLTISMISARTVLVSSRGEVQGVTTSVALLASGVLGLASGLGWYTLTVVAFLALLCALALLPGFESFLKNRSNHFEVHLELRNSLYLQDFVTTIRRLGLRIDNIERNPAYVRSGLSVYSIAISISSEELKRYKTHTEIIEALGTLEYIYHIEEMHI